jgi:hypothetical protein
MQSFFDKFIPTSSSFRPRTTTELFALRLAQKLDDASAVGHYVTLAENHSESQLLCAYRRTLRAKGNGDRGRVFHRELEHTRANGSHERNARLISIRVERRAVAAAIFHSDHLEYADSRQLSSAHDRALASAVGFVNWMLERFSVESAALESIPNGGEFHRRVLHDTVCAVLRDRMLAIWEIPKTVLFESCGRPPLKSRTELREVATSIWPILIGTHAKVFIQDAAVLGLHVQTERLFIINQ